MYSKSIILVRKPLQAMAAEFFKDKEWDVEKQFSVQKYTNSFRDYAMSNIDQWITLYKQVADKCSKTKCQIVFYEDLEKNVIDEMTIVLKFLGFNMNLPIENCLKSIVGVEMLNAELIKAVESMFSKEELEYFKDIYNFFKPTLRRNNLRKQIRTLDAWI